MIPTQDAIASAIERVLGDRQRHEERIQLRPGSERQSFHAIERPLKLRIYVATANGCCAFQDDRELIPGFLHDHIEVVEAEYLARTPVTFANLPPTDNPRVSCPSECKGEMLYLLGKDSRIRPAVDYVAFLDDDIEVTASSLLHAAAAAAQRNCPLFQLQLTHDSHAAWPLLKQRKSPDQPAGSGFPEIWSDISFVEIMAPLVAQAELEMGLLDVLEPFKSGYGWDCYLVPVLAMLYEDFRPGLYRGACMRHTRPVSTHNDSLFSHGLTAVQEEELLRAGLLRCMLQDSPLPDRETLLQRLHDELMANDPKLQAIAAGLRSSTDRQWRARILESQWRQLQEQLAQQQHEMKHAQEVYELELASSARFIAELKRSHTWRIGRLVLMSILWPVRLYQALLSRFHCG
jgi:hypothetical protein